MPTAIAPIERKLPLPPKPVVDYVQQLSDKELVALFKWLDSWARFDPQTLNGKANERIEEIIRGFSIPPEKIVELASRVRVALGEDFSKRRLLDYLKIDKPIVFYDLETAGMEGNDRRIVEVSLVKYFPNGDVKSFTQLLNPEVPIQEEATKKHGITNDEVKDKPTFKDMAPTFKEFFSGSHLGGFNILNFDNRILQKEFEIAGMKFDPANRAVVDVMAIYHSKVPFKKNTKRDLTAAYKYYCGKDLEGAHRAKADVDATIEILQKQFEQYGDLPSDVNKISNLCQNKRSDFVDPKGKFIWGGDKAAFNFGKHRDRSLEEIAKEHPGYLKWILEPGQDFPEDIKRIICYALKGYFPIPGTYPEYPGAPNLG